MQEIHVCPHSSLGQQELAAYALLLRSAWACLKSTRGIQREASFSRMGALGVADK